MRVLRQRGLWRRPDPPRWRVGGPKRGIRPFEILELSKELVVFLVGDRGPIEHVVLVRRALEPPPQVGGAGRELAEGIGRVGAGHWKKESGEVEVPEGYTLNAHRSTRLS